MHEDSAKAAQIARPMLLRLDVLMSYLQRGTITDEERLECDRIMRTLTRMFLHLHEQLEADLAERSDHH